MEYSSIGLLVLIIIIFALRKKRRVCAAAIIRSKHKKKDKISMEELAKNFIGKECIIYTLPDSGTITGVVKEVYGGGITVEKSGNMQIINLEYVTRIREYPLNKKGKKKLFFG